MEQYGMQKTLLFLLEMPSGVRKIDVQNGTGLSPSTLNRIYVRLFENQLITTVPDLGKHLFCLTKKGELLAKIVKTIIYLIPDNEKYKIPSFKKKMDELDELINF